MDNIKVQRMGIEHLDQVFVIEETCFVTPWSKEALRKELTENETAIYLVATDGNTVAGYAGMWHVVNEGHITNIAVSEDYRRRGIGGMIVAELIKLAQSREMIGITLEVRISNIAAQKMYTKYGFKPDGFRKNYYSDTHEDAVIMWRYL